MCKWLSIILITVIIFSCDRSLPELEGVDKQAWEQDKNACKKIRRKMLEPIMRNKDQLLGLKEMDVIELLGKPDQNELYKRNQKFYYYFIEPSPSCDRTIPLPVKRLVIRFNALGLAREARVE